jgi:hypothetical protein
LCAQNSDYGSDDGTSLEAIMQAVHDTHHFVHPCNQENCREFKEYMTMFDNESINFFDLIYTIDEPYKFDHSQKHEYTVNENETFPDTYINDIQYCYAVENGVKEYNILFLSLLLTAFNSNLQTSDSECWNNKISDNSINSVRKIFCY